MRKVRLRFAPSPTGALHIGGIRTALYNFLFARQQGGDFIVRIEDTDQTRYVEGAEKYIMDSLAWLGLNPDEGPEKGGPHAPYRQSERKEIYRKYAEDLVSKGYAYYAFDTASEIEAMKQRLASPENPMPKYDFNSRMSMVNSLSLDKEELGKKIQDEVPYVIRLKVPPGEKVKIQDLVRGEVQFATQELDDKILIKSDGMPTYHMANVIDDRLMEISHVIRGEEWLSSTAHHVLLYRYFGWEEEMPQFSHLPLILKPEGNGKLSKRDGAKFGFPVFPMDWKTDDGEIFNGFKEAGFLPEALINFLVLLGWNSGTDREIYSLQELIQEFSLEKIVKSGARFDYNKAKWFNAHYIQNLTADQAESLILDIYRNHGQNLSSEQADQLFLMYRDRATFTNDFYTQGKYILSKPDTVDPEFKSKKWKKEWAPMFESLSGSIQDISEFNKENLETILKNLMQEKGIKMGELLPTLRVMMSGIPAGPDVYLMMLTLGKIELRDRIKAGLLLLND